MFVCAFGMFVCKVGNGVEAGVHVLALDGGIFLHPRRGDGSLWGPNSPRVKRGRECDIERESERATLRERV